jgi:hypothetical protein
MSKIKKGMMELEETKRINKELFKIFQEHDRSYQTVISSVRPSSVASSTSLNFGSRPSINQNPSSSVIKPVVISTSSNHHVPPPEPDKLMTYEQAMVYAHPALKDACKSF